MTIKEFILKAKINNPFDDLDKLEAEANKMAERWYLTKNIKHRTNTPSKKTWLTPSQIATSYFKEWIDWPIHKRLIELNWDIKTHLEDFDKYRTELNKSWTKMKWQQQDTFEVQKRLDTWLKKQKPWTWWNFSKWKTIW